MPKRIRTPPTSSSSSSDHQEDDDYRNTLDATKFVNLSAQHYYWDVLVAKSFVPERGLKPSSSDGKVLDQIRDLGWILFVETPCSAPMAIVREFYANARETQNGISFVRGQQVSYSPQAITEIFKMPTPSRGATNWVQSKRFATDLDKLVQEMCKPDTQWKLKAGTNEKIHFPQTALNRYAKAWYSFICASILPTSHHQDVTKERAVVLYRILKGRSLDVGLLINQSMLRFMRASTSGGIPHAALITRLCVAAHVSWDEEPLQLPMRDIDSAAIRKYAIWTGGRSHQRGLGFILPESEDDEDEDEEVPVPQPAGPPPEYFANQDREMRRLQRRMDALHTDFSTYTSEFSVALSQAFSQLGANAQFPSFGSSSTYPPADTPPEHGSSDDQAT